MAARTHNGRVPPSGLKKRAVVPAPINRTSRAFMPTITVRLLNRSENTPAKTDTIIRGKVNMTKVCVVCAWEAASKAGPEVSTVAATCLIARRATMSFQALSLNAPKNWAMRSPRRAVVEAESDWGVEQDSVMATTKCETALVLSQVLRKTWP